MTSQAGALLKRTFIVFALMLPLCLPHIASGSAVGLFTVTATPGTWCTPPPTGVFAVVTNNPQYFSFHCSGAFALRADPAGVAALGNYVMALIYAPPGVAITSGTAVGQITNVNNGSGWTAGSNYSGGGSSWSVGSPSVGDSGINSPYWGLAVLCDSASGCSGAGILSASSITLTAKETTGPGLTPAGAGNLWYHTAPGERVWNPPGDPWPLGFAASDASGVCSMSAVVDGVDLPGPSTIPDRSKWQQCPNQTWTPSEGAAVDTRDYVPGDGSLPLTINATNAAQLSTSETETLHVDNDPVNVSLATPNDANPTVWVNHAVTVDATASAGPSGVGGTNCGVDAAASETYSSRGVTVDGDGVHTVTCTAWNNAVGPQGQPNTDTKSLSVHIDEAPPSVSFEPRNPRDLTGLAVNATDSESGVASGSIEMAPAGTNNWTALPTSVAGGEFAAHFDDAQRTGPYVFKATSCDNVGNCASTTQQLTLPVRAASDSEVSLTKIVNPARTCKTKRVKTGPHTWRVLRTCTQPHVRVTTTLREPYGRPVTIHGLYMTGQGVPIPYQRVHILAAPDNGLNDFSVLATATTAGDGSWTATLPPGPSRIIRATTDGTGTILPSSGQVTAIVPAMVRLLEVSPRHVAWGDTVHLVGRLFGGYLPSGGALVRLRIGYKGTYSTYGVEEHVTGDGRFSTVATFGPGDPRVLRTYWFQIASLPMGDYPYAPAASQRVPVIVGGHPG